MRIRIIEIVVIGTVQHVDVRNSRVRDIHVAIVISAAVIPGTKWFAPAQRKPADSPAPAAAKTDSESKSAAEEPNERRSIERSRINRTRAPAPGAADKRPASIMIRREP